MKLVKLAAAAFLGGACVMTAAPAAAIVFPTLTEHNGYYTLDNKSSQLYVSEIIVTNPGAIKAGLDSTTQFNWQAGYCVGGCLGAPAFFFDSQAFSTEIGPGQSSSLFFFTTPPHNGTYDLLLSNPDNSNAGFILGSVTAPEPASWALMLIGIGTVGAALRRRHSMGSAGARSVPAHL